jgi:hypothetical protein
VQVDSVAGLDDAFDPVLQTQALPDIMRERIHQSGSPTVDLTGERGM